MTILQAILIGLVEGITEFLPVSSTGHMILFSQWLKIPATAFLSSFEIYIQLGAIAAVVVLYFKKVAANKNLLKNILIAFAPSVVVGLIFYDLIKNYLFESPKIVMISLFVGGLILIAFEIFGKKKISASLGELENVTVKQALVVGCFQCLAFVPGVSRAAAAIIGGLLAGMKRTAAVEFSFLLAVPTMLAASALDLLKSGFVFTLPEWGTIALGFVAAFLTALLVVKFFIRFVQKRTFVGFGVYRVLIALFFWFFLLK